MPNTTGKIEEVESINKDGNRFLVVTIDGTDFYCHNGELFDKITEGKQVEIEFTKNDSGNKIYRNIQSVNVREESSEGSPAWEKKARALELGIQYVDKVNGDENVRDMADIFIDYMDD